MFAAEMLGKNHGDLLRVINKRCFICGSGGTGRRARLRGV